MKRNLTSLIFVCLFACISINAQTAKPSSVAENLLDLPAPPAVIPVKEKVTGRTRSEEFYDEKNIPPDDAPIEDLYDYWLQKNARFDEFRYNVRPSEKSTERILDALKDKPELLPDFLKMLPVNDDVVDFVKSVYQKQQQTDSSNERLNYGQTAIRGWLRENSDMFLDELLQSARGIKINQRTIDNQQDFEALARVSWDRAKPFIDTFESNRGNIETYVLAKFVQYHHALKEKNLSDAESYREELKKLVEDKSLSHKARDLAMDALVLGGDFEGRGEWYMSLLKDETLLELQENGYTGLTTLPRYMPNKRDEWLPAMSRLIETGTPAERMAAVRNLMLIVGKEDKEVLKILLPWLTDKDWIKDSDDNEREQFVTLLGSVQIPEAVPGLISIITNEKDSEIRSAAALSVSSYDAPQAIPALRAVLREEEENEYREPFIQALLKMKGFSVEEQIAALEAYAVYLVKIKAAESEDYNDEPENRVAVEVSVGSAVSRVENPEDVLILRVIERLKTLQKTNPAAANELSNILQKWNNRLVFIEMLNSVKTGKADAPIILKLLAKRAELREKVPSELSAMRTSDGLPRGLSAVISEDQNEIFNIVKRGDAETQIATLAAARLIRMKIPVGDVAALFSSPNKILALAAGRYLEAEDSLEARNLILSKFADEARILGARKMFKAVEGKSFEEFSEQLSELFSSVNRTRYVSFNESELDKFENSLRGELKQNPDLRAVFAVADNRKFGQAVIRLFKNKIVFTYYEDEARYRERELSPKEYESFYRFLISSGIDTFQPTSDLCFECQPAEFLMFGRGGGRRVSVQGNYAQKVAPFDKLAEFFESFAKSDLKLHYKLADKLKGLEVLLADDKFTARSIWKNGNDFRVLVEDNEKKKAVEEELVGLEKAETSDPNNSRDQLYATQLIRRQEAIYKHFSWRKIENGKITNIETAQPNEISYLGNKLLQRDYYNSDTEPAIWNRRANGFEFRTETGYAGDLVKVAQSGAETVIKQGRYLNPIVSPDAKWLIAEKRAGEGSGKKLVRINLQNGSESPVNAIPSADAVTTLAFVNSQYKFLIVRARFPYSRGKNNPSPKMPEYYLLDPNTGAAQITKNDFRPLLDQTYRGLQPTNNPSEYWAAIFNAEKNLTEIGRFNDKTATFKAVLRMPEISLNSMNIWVDEKESKVYFIYNGHLLSIPLTQ